MFFKRKSNDENKPAERIEPLEPPIACVYAPPEVMMQMREERERQHAEQQERDRLCDELKAMGITPPPEVLFGPLEDLRKWRNEQMHRTGYPRNYSAGDGGKR